MNIEKRVAKIYGKPCWLVKAGVGSFLTLNFGEPRLEIREPIREKKNSSAKAAEILLRRAVRVVGEWRLWIYCCDWRVIVGKNCFATSSSKQGPKRAAEYLDGQKLTRFSIAPRDAECVFRFDLGAVLKTRPQDKDSVQWMLFEPGQKVLAFRGDGRYGCTRIDAAERENQWKPILS